SIIMLETKNKIAVIYCRVSTEEQAKEGLSIESQILTCSRIAEEEGYSVLEVIKDEGKSGKDLNREGIKRIIKLTTEKKINAVYTVSTDRISRKVSDHIDITDLLRKEKVILRALNQPIMDGSATSITMDVMMAGFNQYHRLITSEKVKATMNEKARAGYYPSKAPFGYKNIEDTSAIERFARKIVVIDKDKGNLVREGFRLYSTGEYNVMDITDILYEKGLRTNDGRKVFHSKIYEMLKNPFYIGELHWGEVKLEKAKHPPLVDRELFERVQNILASNNKHSCRKRKFTWLLGGFIRCYKHECRYTAEWHMNKKLAYYHCTKGGCGKFSEQNKLEQMVAEKFKTLEFSKSFIDTLINKIKTIFFEKRENYETKRQGFVNQRMPLESKMRVAENKLLSGTISDEDFKRIREEITKELQIIDKNIINLQKEKEMDVNLAEEVIGLTRNIYETYQKASPQLKRLLLGFFWEKFDVADGLIIRAVPSTLFTELITYEQAFLKSESPQKSNDSNGLIKSNDWCPQ
ncbi:MAG: recombinase family protein, partial [Candidatus Pacebacteria bacterium]|nr:recombinase family protein [Candidatus Paceibacterota bacterium]